METTSSLEKGIGELTKMDNAVYIKHKLNTVKWTLNSNDAQLHSQGG